jgi:hypothetical protein
LIQLTPSNLSGVIVTSNGVDVTSHVGTASPTDLGEYQIVVTAPGFVESRASVKIVDEGKTVSVGVNLEKPRSEPVAAPPPPPIPTPEPSTSRWTERRTLAVGVAGGGLALTIAGLAVGKSASTKWNSAQNVCGPELDCADPDSLSRAQSYTDQARLRGNISTALVIGGLAALGGGIALWLTDSSTERTSVARVLPTSSGGDIGVVVTGRF